MHCYSNSSMETTSLAAEAAQFELPVRPKLLWQASRGVMSSTASTATATDSFGSCFSGSQSPTSSRSPSVEVTAESRRLPLQETSAASSLPRSYLPSWCVKNTFVDTISVDSDRPSCQRRSSSAPVTSARHSRTGCSYTSLEEVRQRECEGQVLGAEAKSTLSAGSLLCSAPRQTLQLQNVILTAPQVMAPPAGQAFCLVSAESFAISMGTAAVAREGRLVLTNSLAQFPSIGSVGHYSRQCTPCAFIHTKGCSNGKTCRFCHLCDKGEKKRRQKQKFGKAASQTECQSK
eukprot:CAMPEP_0178422858 /NCGR_PEP_ID=MMETSP0689_2-20121128/27392_1 /TAXON_ID=160604 /ORGANISM="Amphidinium massartii, Strain CS-259" /LENGTH=289 /DNA_ID=CAMNT_0020044439 /DNA_START=58 /DNA_END=927 /DNA_ORIENTATION=-